MNNGRALWASGIVAAGVLSGLVMFAATPGIPCVQGGICSLGSLSVKGGITVSGTPLKTTAPMTIYVNAAAGSDTNSTCSSTGAGACATIQAACNLIPQLVQHPVTVSVAPGTYSGGGCWLEGRSITSALSPTTGGYIDFEGTPVTAATVSASGSVLSATNLSGNNFATLTPTGAPGFTASALRGFLVQIPTRNNETLAIYDNTAGVITVAGQWPIVPTGADTYTILDPCGTGATFLQGGVTLPVSAPAVGMAAAGGLVPTNNWAVWAFFNNLSSPSAQPAALADYNVFLAWNPGGSIYVKGFCGKSAVASFVQSRNSPGVVVANNKLTSLVPSDFCYVTHDTRMQVVSNYFNDPAVVNAAACHAGAVTNTVTGLYGNVGDNVMGFAQSVGTTDTDDTGKLTLSTIANSWKNIPDVAYNLGDCTDCLLVQDKIEGAAGSAGSDEACVESGVGVRSGSTVNWRGSPSTGTIRGGFWNGCKNGGLHIEGGSWVLRGGTPLTGTNGTYGYKVGTGARLSFTTGAISTMSGSGGDITLDNETTFISLASAATAGIINNPLNGGTVVVGNTNIVGQQISGGTSSAVGFVATEPTLNVVAMSVPQNTWLDLDGALIGAAPAVGLRYDTGTSFLTSVGGNGLLINGAIGITSGGATGNFVAQGSGGNQYTCSSAVECDYVSISGQAVGLDCGGGTCAAKVGVTNATSVQIGTATTTKPVKVAGGLGAFAGTCTFSAGTSCTTTVPSGAVCVATPRTTVTTTTYFCSVSGTTLTCTSTAALTDVFSVICL